MCEGRGGGGGGGSGERGVVRKGNGRRRRRSEKARGQGPVDWFSFTEQILLAHILSSSITKQIHDYINYSGSVSNCNFKFISSISCILLHYTHHSCCGEEDGWYLGNYHGGYCQLPQSSPGLGGRTA